VLVLTWKGAVHPVKKATKRDAGVLPRFARDDAGGRPCDWYEPRSDHAAIGHEAVDERERAYISADHEQAWFIAKI
jgi:hypothetical protein